MNREIKFKIWDNNLKKFVTMNENRHLNAQLFIMLEGGLGEFSVYNDSFWFEPTQEKERFIIQEYTGLKDINKKEIFEGDILEVSEEELVKQSLPTKFCHVWYLDGSWKISYNHLYSEWAEDLANQNYAYKVIGNIFENPELLN